MRKQERKMEVDSLRPLRRENDPVAEDRQAAALFRQVEPLDPLSDLAVVRMRRQLDREIEGATRRSLPLWLRVMVACAATLFFLQVATAAALSAWPRLRHKVFERVAPFLTSHATAPPVSTTGTAIPSDAPPLTMPASSPIAHPSSLQPTRQPPLAPPGAAHSNKPHAAPDPSPTSPPVSGEDEVGLFARALSQLNVEHDPAGALGTLEAYRFQHPDGLFRKEAAVAQLRAEVLLGRDSEALTLLDAMERQGFAGMPQASELGLLRAELLGRVQRCGEALPLLQRYADPSIPAEQRERALYARAACRTQLKDIAASREDLRAYLREFPHGRFAQKVQQALDSSP